MESCQENLQYLPYSLLFLLSTQLQANNAATRIASIGQAIMQNTLPSLILAPLQLGMHRQLGSKFLIVSLYSQGFSLSYAEILRLERCAVAYQGTNIPDLVKYQNHSMESVAYYYYYYYYYYHYLFI